MINPKFVIVYLLGAIYTARPVVIPKSVMAQVGTVARLNCTAIHNKPVYWTTKPYGSQAIREIYIGEKFLVDDYGRSGRFSVEIDSTLRRYDLVIKDVKQSDGGVYICTDELGQGNKTHAEIVVRSALTCQVDQRQESYMGENVFSLDQDLVSFTCRMNYSGNIRPRFEWSVGGRKLNGTQGTESGIASSSLILVATSKLDGNSVTCEALIRGSSFEDTRTGVLWTSDTIRVKYAVLKNEVVKECPGVENSLDCNPPCSYKLETVTGKQRCAVSYATGTDVKWHYFQESSKDSSETGSRYSMGMGVLAAVSCFVLIALALALGYLIKELRNRRKLKIKNTEDVPLKTNGIQPAADQNNH